MAQATRRSARLRSGRLGRTTSLTFTVIWGLVVALPLYYMLLTSFHSQGGYLTSANPWLPNSDFTVEQYSSVLENGFGRYIVNSLVVTVSAIILTLAIGVLAAYRIVLNRTWLSRSAFRYLLIGLAIPVQTLMIPVFVEIQRLGLYDSLPALILTGTVFSLPVTVLILVNFLRDVPRELIEAMQADGASDFRVLWSLILPMSRSVLIMLCVFDGLTNWNQFILPLVLTSSEGVRTLPLQLFAFMDQFGVNVPGVLASVVLSTLPLAVGFVFGYQHLIRGLGGGFVAGGGHK